MSTPYNNSLDPDAMHAALEAFELAWAAVVALPKAYDTNLTRDVLSKRIIQAALENGERDPDRLKSYALEGFKP